MAQNPKKPLMSSVEEPQNSPAPDQGQVTDTEKVATNAVISGGKTEVKDPPKR